MISLGVELKCRIDSREFAKEQENIRRLKRSKYESISSDEVFNNLSKVDERFQLFHNAYVYDISRMLSLVGNKQSFVIQVTLVKFDEMLLHSYSKVLEDLKNFMLWWAYSDNVNKSDDIPSIATETSKLI